VRDGVAARLKTMQATYPRFQPQLAIVQAGLRPDSTVYVKMKAKAAEEVGIGFRHIALPAETDVQSIVDIVKNLNDDEQVSGILVQLPLGDHVTPEGERLVTEAVSPEKDVDGCVSRKLSFCTGFTCQVDFTRSISVICLPVHLFHCLRHVPHLL
jgi:methylenetetrahydrofolate dehydrogenase (NADP+)/methenyltetrahydrofolate cyclohydrolase/formyltetrahydrofolate synthetase